MAEYQADPLLLAFCDREIKPVVGALLSGAYRFPEVQRALNKNLAITQVEYPGEIKAIIFDKTPAKWQGRTGLPKFGCFVKDRFIHLHVFLVSLYKIFLEAMQFRPGTYELIFETIIVIDFIHEMDHIALGKFSDEDGPPPAPGESLEREIIVWARTCENTMRPFVETYGLELYPTHSEMYQKWVESGRNVSSSIWRDYMTNLYLGLHHS